MTGDLITSQESQLLPGVGRLGAQLQENGNSVFYEAEIDGSTDRAVVEIRPAGTPQATQQLNRWQESLSLVHPHLLRLYGAGESMLAETPVIYLSSERADESLAGVLQERPLSEQETSEMLEPILSALTYLHKRGFAHTAIRPDNVRAAGESLKLSSGSILRTDAGGDPTDDMRSVGVLLVQALTQHDPEPTEDFEPYIFRDAAEPLSEIVRHCLEPDRTKRWTAEQALAHLKPDRGALQPPLLLPEPTVVRKQHTPNPVPAPQSFLATHRKAIYGAAAALLILVAATVGLTSKKEGAVPTVPSPHTAANPMGSVPEPKENPANPVPTPIPAAATDLTPPVMKPRHLRAEGWVVVVASYGARGQGEKRASELAKRWPKFHPEVFQPPSQKTRHLVIIGKNLSEDKAEAIRKRARSAGLPQDTYIKRFQ